MSYNLTPATVEAGADVSKPWCTYRTTHITGMYQYEGKGKTANVMSGKYKGSGKHFQAALKHPDFHWTMWYTKLLESFDTEDQAFEAEAALVTLEKLRHPGCLNEVVGGRSGRHQNRSLIVKRDKAEERRERQDIVKAKRKVREENQKAKLAALRQKLKARK